MDCFSYHFWPPSIFRVPYIFSVLSISERPLQPFPKPPYPLENIVAFSNLMPRTGPRLDEVARLS